MTSATALARSLVVAIPEPRPELYRVREASERGRVADRGPSVRGLAPRVTRGPRSRSCRGPPRARCHPAAGRRRRAPRPAAPPRPESPVPPLAEHPTAYLIGDGASCMTRDRGEILALHGQGRCFGRVRGVGGAEAQRHWAELVLSPEETLYLTERKLVLVWLMKYMN